MKQLLSAKKWAHAIWQREASHWKVRRQDLNFKRYVVMPGFTKVFRELAPVYHAHIVDLGCGDGVQTIDQAKLLAGLGWRGALYGYDPLSQLTEIAKKRRSPWEIRTHFGSGSFESFVAKHKLRNAADVVLSTFVLQDTPDLIGFLKNQNKILRSGGMVINLVLHPRFSAAMAAKGETRAAQNLTKTTQWRWAAEYPIFEEQGKTFYVPLFHRTKQDYIAAYRKYFKKVKTVDLMPDPATIKESQKKKILPFSPVPGNMYYPEMVKIPSAMIIVAQK